jgi:hypothetical protein
MIVENVVIVTIVVLAKNPENLEGIVGFAKNPKKIHVVEVLQ